MEHISLKQTDELQRIMDFTGWAKLEVEERIFEFMLKHDLIADSSDEWGKTLGEILREENKEPEGVAIMTIRTTNPEIMLAFGKLMVIGKGDCTECGGDHIEEHGDNMVCGHCGHETRPRGLERDYEHFTKL